MKHGECGFTSGGILVVAYRIDFGIGSASHGDVGVPEPDVTWRVAGHIYLDDSSSLEDVGNGEAHVLDLTDAGLPWSTNHDHRVRTVGIEEVASDTFRR